jgi:hypothetical protein
MRPFFPAPVRARRDTTLRGSRSAFDQITPLHRVWIVSSEIRGCIRRDTGCEMGFDARAESDFLPAMHEAGNPYRKIKGICRWPRRSRKSMLTLREVRMLTRKTSRNQVALTFTLRPITLSDAGSRLSAIRRKVAALGLEPSDID